jgi:hypothetical protein
MRKAEQPIIQVEPVNVDNRPFLHHFAGHQVFTRQEPDFRPALHRIAEAQRSVNNPSWGSPSIISNLFELRKGVNFVIHQFLQFAARADELWMRYDGWSFGADECHAGYAFFK